MFLSSTIHSRTLRCFDTQHSSTPYRGGINGCSLQRLRAKETECETLREQVISCIGSVNASSSDRHRTRSRSPRNRGGGGGGNSKKQAALESQIAGLTQELQVAQGTIRTLQSQVHKAKEHHG